MRQVLLDFIPDIADVFVDDMFIFGPENDEGRVDGKGRRLFIMQHFKDLERIFRRLAEVSLTVSGRKAFLAVGEIDVLGYTCSAEGKRLTVDLLERVDAFPTPTDKTTTRSFLGLGNSFHMFIPNYATISRPLVEVAKPTSTFCRGRSSRRPSIASVGPSRKLPSWSHFLRATMCPFM